MKNKGEDELKQAEIKAIKLLNKEYIDMERRRISKGQLVQGFAHKLEKMNLKLGGIAQKEIDQMNKFIGAGS